MLNKLTLFICGVEKEEDKVFYFIFNLFDWRVISIQYCVGFCHTTT